jgi:hypothetical protein
MDVQRLVCEGEGMGRRLRSGHAVAVAAKARLQGARPKKATSKEGTPTRYGHCPTVARKILYKGLQEGLVASILASRAGTDRVTGYERT